MTAENEKRLNQLHEMIKALIEIEKKDDDAFEMRIKGNVAFFKILAQEFLKLSSDGIIKKGSYSINLAKVLEEQMK